jgi:hypothetical protein
LEKDISDIPSSIDSSGVGQGPVAGSCGRDNEPSGSIKYWECFCVAEQLLASQDALCSMELLLFCMVIMMSIPF